MPNSDVDQRYFVGASTPGSARGFRRSRCRGCGLPLPLCLCQAFAPLEAPLRITVIMPPNESYSSSNTGRLLALWLRGTSLVVRGAAPDPEEAHGPGELAAPNKPLVRCDPGSALLFPDESITSAARVREPCSPAPRSRLQQPLPTGLRHLIVPDGTWAQARRIVRRELLPLGPPRIALAAAWPSAYRLRRKAQGLCTFEAVAVTLALYGAAEVAMELLTRFMLWSERQAHIKRGGSLVMPCAPHPAHPALAALAELSTPSGAAR